jgi:hypothetical protein
MESHDQKGPSARDSSRVESVFRVQLAKHIRRGLKTSKATQRRSFGPSAFWRQNAELAWDAPSMHVYEVISDVLPFGRLWYDGPEAVANATGYAEFYSRSHDVVIRVYDAVGNVIETHEHEGDFKKW